MTFVHKIACGNEGAFPGRLLGPRSARLLGGILREMASNKIAPKAAMPDAGFERTV